VTVIVLTSPVTVSRDTTGVGVHVRDDEGEDVSEVDDEGGEVITDAWSSYISL
jgi:hypothetical protein